MRVLIRIQGHLDQSWQEWFEGLEIVHDQRGITLFSGSLSDQAALYGVLLKIRNLGLTLVSFENGELLQRTNEGCDKQQLLSEDESSELTETS